VCQPASVRLTRGRTLAIVIGMSVVAPLIFAFTLPDFSVRDALLAGALLLAMGVYYTFYFYSRRR
jgi:hypothetical protein